MLRVPLQVVKEIATQAREEAPNEACGYLAGTDGTVRKRYPMTNVDASPEHFSLDPKEQFAVLKQAREGGLALLAVYHSHPETPARMSNEDIRLANDTSTIYLIHSLLNGETRGFTVDREKNVTEIPVEVFE